MSHTIKEITKLKEQAIYNITFANSQKQLDNAKDAVKYLNTAIRVLNNKKENQTLVALSAAYLRSVYNDSNRDLLFHTVRKLDNSVLVIKEKRKAINITLRAIDKFLEQ